jgi:hypothetical protein
MQRREDKMARLGGLRRSHSSLRIPNLAHQNYVGTLSERSAQALRKAGGIDSHLALGEQTLSICEKVFNRILDGDNMATERLIHPFQAGCQRGTLAGTGRPADQDKSGFSRDPLTENFGRETKRFQIRNVATNSAEDGRVSTKLSEQVDPEPNAFSGSKTRIMILRLFGGTAGSAERIEERAVERSGLEHPKFSGDS